MKQEKPDRAIAQRTALLIVNKWKHKILIYHQKHEKNSRIRSNLLYKELLPAFSIDPYFDWLNSFADYHLAPITAIAPPMPNPITPPRPLILQFLEQLYELNDSDALAAFLANPNCGLPAEFADRLQTLQPHIDRAHQNAAHTQQLQTHLTQLQQIRRIRPIPPTIHLTQTAFVPIGLTTRQSEILFHVAQGGTNDTIGQTLGIHPATVKTHLTNIYQRLNVNSRLAAVATALKQIGIHSSIHN